MDHTEKFLYWAERDRGRAVNTIARYQATLKRVEAHAGTEPIYCTIEQVEAWWASRYDASPATRENELGCLRTFYRWAMKFDHRPDDPTRRLDPPKVPNRIPRPIGQSDLDRLLGPLTEEALDLRKAIALGAYGGLRVSEAAGLDWANIDLESRRIYVRGKGAKERVVGLSSVLLDKLLPEATGNVVTAGGQPYSGPALQRRVNRLIARHGINYTFHDLRKRGASLAMERVRNPQAVAQAFGWASLQTVTHYAVVSDETLDEIAQAMV